MDHGAESRENERRELYSTMESTVSDDQPQRTTERGAATVFAADTFRFDFCSFWRNVARKVSVGDAMTRRAID